LEIAFGVLAVQPILLRSELLGIPAIIAGDDDGILRALREGDRNAQPLCRADRRFRGSVDAADEFRGIGRD